LFFALRVFLLQRRKTSSVPSVMPGHTYLTFTLSWC